MAVWFAVAKSKVEEDDYILGAGTVRYDNLTIPRWGRGGGLAVDFPMARLLPPRKKAK